MDRMRRTWMCLGAIAAGQLAVPALARPVPFPLAGTDIAAAAGSGTDHDRALQCMALAIAYEAGLEPLAGQQAVGEVILNRTRHPAYPKTVCNVVFQGSARRTGCQFTFTCDGALNRALPDRIMAGAREVARQVLDGEAEPRVGGATHYHASYVRPYWAPSLIRVGQIGAHIFYRAPGSADGPARYVGTPEPEIPALGQWASAIDPLTQGTGRNPGSPAPGTPTAPPQVFAPWGLAVR